LFPPPFLRFALNIKGLPYKTEWLNFANLEEQLKERNVSPSKVVPESDGFSSFYSVPAIHDPSTNTVVEDSHKIIKYLDETYPDTPRLTTHPATLTDDDDLVKPAFEPNWHLPLSLMFHGIWGLAVPSVVAHSMDEAGAVKYREKFELKTGVRFESVLGEDKKQELLEKGRQNFSEVDAQLRKIREKYGGDGPWMFGKDAKLPDLAIAGSLAWLVSIKGEESDLWKEVRTWDEGRWAKIWDEIKPYYKLF
jgi:glutathione S-transferase